MNLVAEKARQAEGFIYPLEMERWFLPAVGLQTQFPTAGVISGQLGITTEVILFPGSLFSR